MKKRKPPKATKVKNRDLFRAWGIDPATQARKPYYAATSEKASKDALDSFGNIDAIETLDAYYANVFLATITHRSQAWKNQVGWAMDKYVLPMFGQMAIDEIKRDHCQKLFNSLQRGMAVSSVRRIKIVFSSVMNLAEADERITRNPVRLVKLPADVAPEKTALTFADLAKLYRAAKDRFMPPFLLCSCAGGLRVGEACAVTRAHLTSDDVLKVRIQITQHKGGAAISKTLKTPQTKRDIPLPAGLADAIRDCKQVSGIYISSDSRGGYLLPKNFVRLLQETCDAARVDRVSPHELRHTFISLMENELEAPTAIVAALAGKKDSRVTAGYSHAHRDQMKKWLSMYWQRLKHEAEKLAVSQKNETQDQSA